MHYRSGKEAKVNDLILWRTESANVGTEIVGIVTGASSQSTTCNATIATLGRRVKSELGWGPWLPFFGQFDACATLSECDKVESWEGAAAPGGEGTATLH